MVKKKSAKKKEVDIFKEYSSDFDIHSFLFPFTLTAEDKEDAENGKRNC